MKKTSGVVPTKLEDLRQRLEQWRSTHKRRGRIPETLWAEAAELARQHGIYQTARTLRLEYTRLWCHGVPPYRGMSRKTIRKYLLGSAARPVYGPRPPRKA